MELLLCFVITFAVLIFILSVREISYKKVFYKHKFDSIIVIPMNSDNFSEIYLKYCIELIKNSDITMSKVILLDNGLDFEQYEICENIAKYNDMLKLIRKSDLIGYVDELLK